MSRKQTIAIAFFAIVSCATIYGAYHKYLEARTTNSSQVSINDRYFFNRLGLELIKQNPITGVGVGNYIDAQKNLRPLFAWQHQPPHNIFIFIAAELGILGLTLFSLILFEILTSFKFATGSVLTFSLGLAGIVFIIMSQFDHYFATIQQGRLMLFTVLGLIAALPNLKKETV